MLLLTGLVPACNLLKRLSRTHARTHTHTHLSCLNVPFAEVGTCQTSCSSLRVSEGERAVVVTAWPLVVFVGGEAHHATGNFGLKWRRFRVGGGDGSQATSETPQPALPLEPSGAWVHTWVHMWVSASNAYGCSPPPPSLVLFGMSRRYPEHHLLTGPLSTGSLLIIGLATLLCGTITACTLAMRACRVSLPFVRFFAFPAAASMSTSPRCGCFERQ